MPFGTNPELYSFTRKLIHLRRSNPALTHGKTQEILADREIYAYLRETDHSKVLTLVNNSSYAQERTFEMPESIGNRASWINFQDGSTFPSSEEELKVKINPRSTMILLFENDDILTFP